MARPEFQIVESARNAIVDELRSNPRSMEPTRYEQMLDVFIEYAESGIVPLDVLSLLFENVSNPYQLARDNIVRLNQKLEPFGLKICHVPAYQITTIDSKS